MSITMRQMLEAGVHFGHQTRYWNPKMAPFIFGHRNRIHIVNLEKTMAMFQDALKYARQLASNKGTILFVGTKRQAAEAIQREAGRCGMPYVDDRWLGGALTNFRTVRSRLGRLEELEEIRSGDQLQTYSKKMQSSLNREYRKMFRNLNGIRAMNRLPECLVVIDPKKEKNAVTEARKLGIPVTAILDSNSDPDGIAFPIPGNDDAARAIALYCDLAARAVIDGLGQGQIEAGVDVGAAAEIEDTSSHVEAAPAEATA